MKKRIIMMASAAFLMTAAHAYALTPGAMATNDANTGSNHNPQRNLSAVPPLTEKDARGALDTVIQKISGADTRKAKGTAAPLIEESGAVTKASSDVVGGAATIIGKDVLSENGAALAKVEDIIMDRNGRATMVVVSNGGLFGIGGKKAAFDYDSVIKRNASGDALKPLTEDVIKTAAIFSYDPVKDDTVRLIPAGGYGTAALLTGGIADPDGGTVADVRDIVFRQGKASKVIASVNQVMGMGGDYAVLRFDRMQVARTDSGARFRMSTKQAAELEEFKLSSLRNN